MEIDWQSLFKRAPELRPRLVCFWNDGSVGIDGIEDADAASALCRDKAVRWLGENGQVPKLIVAYVGETWTWELRINEGEPGERRFSGSLDAVLHVACTAVLDARDAAPIIWRGRKAKFEGDTVFLSRENMHDDFDTGQDPPEAAFALSPGLVPSTIYKLEQRDPDVLLICSVGGMFELRCQADGQMVCQKVK